MSQLRVLSRHISATITLAVVLALLFGVAASGTAAASAPDPAFRNDPSASAGLFACFKRHMTQRVDLANADRAQDGHKNAKHPCPSCCLAAHGAVAVLPSRVATPASPRVSPSPLYRLSLTAHEPEGAGTRAAHGARAPPSLV
jgi:hypothetical protein